jgi:subtilase family serine protease
MSSSGLRRVAIVVIGSVATIGLAAIAAVSAHTAGAASPGRRVLPWVRPSWTSAVAKTGDVPSGQIVRARVWLAPRNAAQLSDLAKAVSQPGSPQYARYITADQYRAQYAPTQSQVDEVTQWLTGAGLSVTKVGPDNHYVAVSGTAAAIDQAFGTELGTFTVNGRHTRAPATDVSVPGSVAGFVLGITGLTPFGHMVKPADFGAPDAFVNAPPCSSYYGEKTGGTPPFTNNKYVPYAVCGYVPSQFRDVYGIGSSTGAGETIAFVDAYDAPTLLSDANLYASLHGDPGFGGGQFTDKSVPEDASTGDDCGGNTWYGEQTLDLEAMHGMALAANVLYYGAASCFDDDLLAALTSAVSDDQASIISNSWGMPTFVRIGTQVFPTVDQNIIDVYESVFEQGAVQGIGFYFSSGDDGDDEAAWGYKHPDYPADDPWVTAVGGTALGIGSGNQRLFETGWGTAKYDRVSGGWSLSAPFLYGSGGGFSRIFPRPLYQLGVAPLRSGGRAVPDIAMDGDVTTGILVGETQNFSLRSDQFGGPGILYGEARYGGTSLSVQLFAGVQADAQEAAGGARIGFANPLIYWLAGQRGVYNDIFGPPPDAGNVRVDYVNGINADDGVVYSLRTFNQDASLKTGLGWDDVTGVGTPTSRYLTAVANALP